MALAAKSLWRLIYNEEFWAKVMKFKYLEGSPMEEWLRLERKCVKGGSIVWKALVSAFPLLRKWIAWKVGTGKKVRIGDDPWLGCQGNFRLSDSLLSNLHSLEIFCLDEAACLEGRNGWSQG